MKKLVLSGLLAVFMLASSQAQPVTITEADVRARLDEGDFAFQMLFAGLDLGGEMSPEDSLALQNSMQAILDEIGEGGTYDLTGIDFTLFTDVALEIHSLPVSDEVPGAGVFNATDAEYVSSNAGFFGTSYNYLGIESDGLYDYGTATEGEEPDVNDPPARTMALPLEMGTSWSRVTESSFAGIPMKDSTYAEVVGYGELVTAAGAAATLVVREETFSEFLGSTETSVTYMMYTRDLRMSAGIQINAEGIPEGIFYTVESSASADPVAVTSGFTGDLLSELGLDIDLTSASATDGTLQAFRIGFVPVGGEFSGSAQSGSGSQIAPDMVVGDGYFVVHATGLSGFEYRVCMDYDGVDVAPGSLVILRREDSASPWMPQATTHNAGSSEVCASGLTAFSHFALGASSSDVGTAVEDGTEMASDFVLYGSAPNPVRDVTTIRYELARSTDVTLQVYDALGREVATLVDGWQRDGAQEARFDASALPNGLYVYRLTAGGATDSRSLIVVK